MAVDSIRWDKTPKLSCSCGVEKVWRTLRLLPKIEVNSIIEKEEAIQVLTIFNLNIFFEKKI
jgi:redox-regulated HSP33 family molecular chaperone